MRCEKCNYRLWGIGERRCPECGDPFLPSDFDFIPNSVQFKCPHCGQSYYGTDEKGHLVPRAFDCVACGQAVDMDDMVMAPAAGVSEDRVLAQPVPWVDRSRQGFAKAWFKTALMSFVAPFRMMRGMPPETSAWSALWFALLTIALCTAVGASPLLIIPVMILIRGGGGNGLTAALMITLMFGAGVLATAIYTLVWGGVTHLILRVTGGSEHGFGRTMHAIWMSAGTNMLVAVPCIGPYLLSSVAAVWWPISAILMVQEGQKVSGVRATISVLTLPVLSLLVVVIAYAIFMVAVLAELNADGNSVFGPQPVIGAKETQVLGDELLRYRDDHDGAWPVHGAALLHADYVDSSAYVGPLGTMTPMNMDVSGFTMNRFEAMEPEGRELVLKGAAEDLGDDVIAHRVGDFVFIYHGVPPVDPEPHLWVMVHCLEAGSGQRVPFLVAQIIAYRADGTVEAISPDSLVETLETQNQLRALILLEPLPDPRDVTHATPARAGDP